MFRAQVVEQLWIVSEALLKDKDQQVKNVAEDGVVEYVPLCSKELIMSPIMASVLELANGDVEEHRMTAMKLLGEFSFALGQQTVKETVSGVLVNLASDAMFRVRKTAALYIGKVRNSAFQHLGPLIATLSCEEVTPKLLQYYASMATGKGNSGGAGDSEMPTFCAYNFPAVVLTVGRDNWKHLEEAYKELVKDIQWKVRRTLSFSVHEIALILGPELTQSSLLPALDTFLRDLDEVKVGVLQNLAKLLGVLTPAARQQYVPLLCNLEMESDNWRFRQLLAQQLGELFFLFEEEVIQTELYPIFMKLCRDPVAEVRNMAGQQLIPILARLKDLKVNWMDEFIEELQDLATDRLFQHRLMFAHMCHAMAKQGDDMDREVFNKDFLPQLLDLSEDQVGNIRQRAGLALQLLVGMSGIDDSKVKARIAKLVSDKDIEVLRSMGCAMNLGTTSCRHYNLANGAAKDAELRAAMTS
ncbi:armadillo-type protein [Baffinella frigidus]|nr:armadillo-type protein [Cryptophyta sp. CCMP2293]